MDALLLTFALFAFWGLIGYAAISLSSPRLRLIQGVLISPAIGIAVTVLPVFILNRSGIPVKDFGGILLPVLAALAVAILVIKRPVFPARRCLPFLGISVAALFLSARPMFDFGFDWVSFSNDDMANYCLAAQRFYNHGFFDNPNLEDLGLGRDYSLAYWFMHVANSVRPGSDLMLAVVWAFSGLNAIQVFMPVIMALHLALVAASGSMVSGPGTSGKAPIIAMSLMALSPMTTLGSLYQLIGQVGGLALLCAAVTLMYRPRPIRPISRHFAESLAAAAVCCAIFVWYPEALPFLGLGWILYALLLLRTDRPRAIRVALPALSVGVLVSIALNKYVLAAVLFMMGQASAGLHVPDLSNLQFPYFLVPSGVGVLWGLISLVSTAQEPFVSLAIAGGLLLSYWLVRRVIPHQVRNVSAAASMLLLMAGMGLLLFYRDGDFGLFKLAMFVQPFLACAVALELARLHGWGPGQVKKIIVVVIVLVPMFISQYGLVSRSAGDGSGTLIEIPFASPLKVNRQFDSLIQTIRLKDPNATVMSETPNIVLAKFQAFHSRGVQTLFPSRNFFSNLISMPVDSRSPAAQDVRRMAELPSSFASKRLGDNEFEALKGELRHGRNNIYVYSLVKSEIFNTYGRPMNIEGNYFKADPAPHDRLQFIHSRLGNHYYLGADRKKTAFFQMEADPMFPAQQAAALGRHLLFELVNPSKRPRVVMELTSTVFKQFNSELPRPRVQDTRMAFVGRGSGRIFSEPIEPTYIDGVPYLSIDMMRDGLQFHQQSKGLMMLYGRDVPLDQRRITTFGRDISLVSREQYSALQPPSSLQVFPADLADKNLEYSGIYEDGWISELSYFVLSPRPSARFLVVRGNVPQIEGPDFSSILRLSVDGREIAQRKLGLGAFEVKVPVTRLEGRQRVGIAFSNCQQLPGEDGRVTGGRIELIGFTEERS